MVSPYWNETDETVLLTLFLGETVERKMKLEELEIGQKYFVIWITNSWKPQKIIITVRKLSTQCAYSWRGFAEGIMQIALFVVLCFQWSVKKASAS